MRFHDFQSQFVWILLLVVFELHAAEAFSVARWRQRSSFASSQSRNDDNHPTIVNNAFERWFDSCKDSFRSPHICHDTFSSSLRGLAWTSSKITEGSTATVLQVPSSMVLSSSSDLSSPNWDADLAVQLWKQVQQDSQSNIYGYCQLLQNGALAPHALRHWTDDQLQRLSTTQAGRRLLDLSQTQQDSWKSKYQQLKHSGMLGYSDFAWAMEAVHSRAFSGDYGQQQQSVLLAAAVPVLAAGGGWWLYNQTNNPNTDWILAVLAALLALLPSLASQQSRVAVLLPFVDSANHMDTADSSIDYNPLQRNFALTIGPKCLVPQDDKIHLYIRYGTKSNEEWLLNYGFLPGLPPQKSPKESDDEYRARLADEFHRRTSTAP